MKLTKKTVKHEVETTEAVCEITKVEFEQMCAKTAAKTITEFIGTDADIDDIVAGIQLTSLFAKFAARLSTELFTDNDTTENPDKKEEK